MSNVLLRNCSSTLKCCPSLYQARVALSSVPAERKADFSPRVITSTFPNVEIQKLRRGTGGRSSFNGLIVTVFGATGFLGKSLVNELGRIGTQVIVPYRSDCYKIKDLKLAGDLGQVLFVPFHLRDRDSLYRAMKHSNVVINLIGQENETTNFNFDSVHVQGAQDIASIARELGIERLVHMSALNSSPNPEPHWIKGGSKFLQSKYFGEQAVREVFPEATIFRPADIYGLLDHYLWQYAMFYRRSLRALPLANGGYGITKTPVAVADVAKAIVNSLTDNDSIGQTYDAVGPRRYELRELMEYFQEVVEKYPDEGFKITNLRWSPFMRLRISFLSKFPMIKKPVVHWEKIERENISDEKPKNKTLSDLGVKLTHLEDKWPYELAVWRYNWSYEGDYGEKKLFQNPRYIVE